MWIGECYSREALVAIMKLCQKHRIHFVSDEIYALSKYENEEAPDAPTFTSALSIPLDGVIDPELVHVLYGMSKVLIFPWAREKKRRMVTNVTGFQRKWLPPRRVHLPA
jgi:aspartate/methionine/tyrosine aminotransferase